MNPRQAKILQHVVESHIKTGEPVSSGRLVGDFDLQVSPATVRNDLYALEGAGYLRQPHTSAGRVPTETGYRFYVDELREDTDLIKQEQELLCAVSHGERRLQEIAKALAELTGETLIVAMSGNSVYYTGVKNLFSKPEFAEAARVVAMSELLDNIEECLDELLDKITHGVTVHIGTEGCFGENCSTISTRISPEVAYVLLGSMRMQYGRNIGLLRSVQQLL